MCEFRACGGLIDSEDSLNEPRIVRKYLLPSAIVGLFFGSVQCVAWKFIFPSMTERTLWRVSAVVAGIGPTLVLLILVMALVFLRLIRTRSGTFFREVFFPHSYGYTLSCLFCCSRGTFRAVSHGSTRNSCVCVSDRPVVIVHSSCIILLASGSPSTYSHLVHDIYRTFKIDYPYGKY